MKWSNGPNQMIKWSKSKSNDPNDYLICIIKWSKWLFDLHNQMIQMTHSLTMAQIEH